MIFKEIFDEKWEKISDEIDELVNKAFSNQTHQGDLLLIYSNGFYNPEVFDWNNLDEQLSPFMIGPNNEGHSENLHYEFINNYRHCAISKLSFEEYKKKLKFKPSKSDETDKLTDIEVTTIQLEMLIYLKIWEADAFIKRLYQIVRLVNGERYDWYFKIAESNRDKEATGARQEIIRNKIRDKLKVAGFPNIFSCMKKAYNTQIRNSIAHSQYLFLGRNIHFNNFIKGDKASQLGNVPFDKWIDIFHETLAIHNGYIKMVNSIQELYEKMSEINPKIQVRKTEIKEAEEESFSNLEYSKSRKIWVWEREK